MVFSTVAIHAERRIGTEANPVKIGVVLPINDNSVDGKRMTEYYRGVLMACDSLKKEGISIDICAWDVSRESDLSSVLSSAQAADRDLMIGPFYSNQVRTMADFTRRNNTLLLIPFSIDAPESSSHSNVFQVYQSAVDQNEATVRRFCNYFQNINPIIVDCNDAGGAKGMFTSALRRELQLRNITYRLTSLSSTDENFRNAFVSNKHNIVILNSSGRSSLNTIFGRLSSIKLNSPELQISLFGYTDWLAYANSQLENFYQYDVYLPSTFYFNPLVTNTETFINAYRANFGQEMLQSWPRLSLTGFDHSVFFIRGLLQKGANFNGAATSNIKPLQTPLKFERIPGGGYQNRAFMFVHYLTEQRIETINY